MASGNRLHQLSKLSQNFCINGIGLGQLTYAAGKISYLSRIDNDNRQVCLQQFGNNGSFVASGCFKDNKSDVMIFEALTKLAMTIRCVWQIVFQDIRATGKVECVF